MPAYKRILIDDSNNKIAEHFTCQEFYKPAGHSFYFPEALVKAADILRNYFDVPIIITSTSRPNDSFGFHRYDEACDYISKEKDIMSEFKTELNKWMACNESELIEKLRLVGITGFGVEQVCIHLDVRSDHTHRKDKYGWYAPFEYRQDAKGKILINKGL